ncbi:MAG: polysaccharide biosynthesis protein [Clostridiales bacterium]|jgi:FlaA1/EpsC-like NDP-sugar epimerase|nr:polysaccharide biosynthesis protein [Clostridiales bacterium]
MDKFFRGKKILIIGGTGTIGTAILEKLLGFDVQAIRIFSRDEHKQFNLQEEHSDRRLRFLLGDVRDYERVCRASEDIDVIFNLAALKHVPACEYNPYEAVKTNVLGAQNVIQAAIAQNVGHVVLSSSDKSVSPTNAMGATKLLAERLILSASNSKGPARTKFCAVRFGNVMGSRGSVIPLFKRQILKSMAITLTNPDMTRFMMSSPDAASLTMDAVRNTRSGEVFVLKMPVVKMSDLAEAVIGETCRKYALDPKGVAIREVGLRPGEKMYEELMTAEEAELAFDLGSMYMIAPQNLYSAYASGSDAPAPAQGRSYSSETEAPLAKEKIREAIAALDLV